MFEDNNISEGECLDDSLDAREDLWDIQEMMFGRSARSILNGGRLKAENRYYLKSNFNVENAKKAYATAKVAKVGDEIVCAFCGKRFIKKTYNMAFCKSKGKANCKDRYWNSICGKRKERAIEFSGRK